MASKSPRARPMSVGEITKEAANFYYDDSTPLKYWLRSADAIQKQAESYKRDGSDQEAYILLFRHALLVLEKLLNHPEAKLPRNKAPLRKASQAVNANLPYIETLKPRVEQRYKEYTEAMARREAERGEWKQSNNGDLADDMATLSIGRRKGSDVGIYAGKKALEAGQNKDLATRLARRAFRHRDRELEPTSPPRPSRTQEESDSRSLQRDIDALAHQLIDRNRTGQEHLPNQVGRRDYNTKTFTPAPPQYPTVPSKSAYEIWGETKMKPLPPSSSKAAPSRGVMKTSDTPPPRPAKSLDGSALPPPRPSKRSGYDNYQAPPAVPSKISSYPSPPPKIPRPATPPSRSDTPALDSSQYTFKPSAYLESGHPLRTIFLPDELRARFLKIASPNTSRNLETCGILAGTLISNAFFINTLIIPHQESTSDTCEMTHEESLWSYCDSHDLLIVGWIHTHPSQTCFLSSRDLHTHAGFQMQLEESIAIVLAPSREPSWGIFRLTDPPGKQVIGACRKPGVFHPHDQPQEELYIEASRPGHVVELDVAFGVVDLREEK